MLTAADFATATARIDPGSPPSKYTIKTVPVKTDVGPAVEQHSACEYHFSGDPGVTGTFTLDVMTAAEYKTLGQFDQPKPLAGIGDEAAVFGERPAVRVGGRAALIANTSATTKFSIEFLRIVVTRL